MASVRLNSPSLKYQRFPPLGCQDIRIRKFEFVAKTQFLSDGNSHNPKEGELVYPKINVDKHYFEK